MLAGLTLLPALLTIFGRAASGRARSTVDYDPEHAPRSRVRAPGGASATRSCSGRAWRWRHAARSSSPARSGLLAYKVDYSTTTFFKKSVESVEGFERARARPSRPASLAPTTMLVESDSGPVDRRRTIAAVDGRSRASREWPRRADTGQRSTDGRIADARRRSSRATRYTKSALDIVPRMRDAVADLPPGVDGAGRRRQRDPLRLRPGDRARPEADRAAGAARDRRHPRDPAAGARRAAGPDRERDPLVPLHARDLDPVHPLRRRRRRASTPRSRPSPSSSWSRSGSTTRSS